MTTTRERGRPARTSLAQLRLSPPRRSTANGTAPGSICKGCSRFTPHCHSPLERESHEMKTTRERGRPARTSLAQLHLSPPRRSTANGTVPGSLCKGCSRFTPHYHSPLEGESHEMKTTRERDGVAQGRRHLPASAARPRQDVRFSTPPEGESTENSCAAPARTAPRGHAGSLQRPDLLKTSSVRHSPLSARLEQESTSQDSIARNDPSHPLNPRP